MGLRHFDATADITRLEGHMLIVGGHQAGFDALLT
jgi:hypothetical protein